MKSTSTMLLPLLGACCGAAADPAALQAVQTGINSAAPCGSQSAALLNDCAASNAVNEIAPTCAFANECKAAAQVNPGNGGCFCGRRIRALLQSQEMLR